MFNVVEKDCFLYVNSQFSGSATATCHRVLRLEKADRSPSGLEGQHLKAS